MGSTFEGGGHDWAHGGNGNEPEDKLDLDTGHGEDNSHLQNEEGDGEEDEDEDLAGNENGLRNGGLEEQGEADDLPSHPVSHGLGDDDRASSTPDDTPSVQNSQRSSSINLRSSPGQNHHRPFDLRFQSRLSSPSSRTSSPFLGYIHSRHSSLVSQLSPGTVDADIDGDSQDPWDVVRWTKLRKISGQAFSELGKRNFGHPTCLAVTTSIVIGTAKGIVLVFDYQQSLKAIIGTSTKALECGAVTSLALSADHSTVAAGHASGDIFTWEISRSARPFLHIPPIPSDQVDSRTADGHIANSAVVHVGFLGTRRTALVSADTRGMAFSHLATRGMGAVGRTVKTTRILGRYPQTIGDAGRPRKPSAVLAFSPLPLGNVEQPTDGLGLVAMLTPYLLVIVSTTPVAQTQHKAPRPKEVTAHGAMTGALAWFPAIRLKGKDAQISRTKLVYCWSNVLTVLDVSELETDEPPTKEQPPQLVFKARSRWKADEAIVAVQWLSRSVMAVLTITQQLLIVEDRSMRVTDSIDLLNRQIYHTDLFSAQLHSLVEQLHEDDPSMHGVVADSFYMSFRSYKGRLFLLGFNETLMGALSNWADRLLALMEAGDFIGAIRLATTYYNGNSEKLTVGLPEEDALRQPIVQERLLEMISASLKFAFGQNAEANNGRLESPQLAELVEASIAACVCVADTDFLWDEVFAWYEDHQAQGIFVDALEPYIVEGTVRSLPPTAVKALINHFAVTHSAGQLEEIICLLDTTTMDIDQVTTLCKQYNLYDAYIYVWNRCLDDYITPLQELLTLIPEQSQSQTQPEVANTDDMRNYTNAMKVFPYLSFVLTGRIYPTGDSMDEAEAIRAKGSLYSFLFSGGQVGNENPTSTSTSTSYSTLRTMLQFDSSSFMSMLNEAFEDSFLNEEQDESPQGSVSVNRQYLITILLQVMSTSPSSDAIYLDMFVARNLPKYPQYILLSGTTLHHVLERLCRYPNPEMADDCELSVEYLLSFYHPPDLQSLIALFQEARFFRVLKSTYRAEKQFPQLILTYLDDPNDRQAVFTCLQDCLRLGSGLGKKQRREVLDVVQDNAKSLVGISVTRAAQTMQDFAPDVHDKFLRVLEDDSYGQYQYLSVLIEPHPAVPGPTAATAATAAMAGTATTAPEHWMVERYVQLLCKYNPSHVADFVDDLRVGDVRLDEILPSIEESGVVDAAVILLARQGQVRAAMNRLVSHLGTLASGLVGILRSVRESPDSATTAEAINDLVESLNKYARVGTWLCQGQTKTARQPSPRKTNAHVHTNGNGNGNGNGTRGSPVRQSTSLDQPLSFEETLWLDLIEAVVRIASNVFSLLTQDDLAEAKSAQLAPKPSQYGSNATQLISSFRSLVQQVFTALLSNTIRAGTGSSALTSTPTPSTPTSSTPLSPRPHSPSSTPTLSVDRTDRADRTASGTDRTDLSFLRILRAFLTRAASWSPSLLELRAVLATIFSAYMYEQSLLSLANGMLDRDLFTHVDEVTRLRQRGWRPRGQVCEVCHNRVWGPGLGEMHWRAWQRKGAEDSTRRFVRRVQGRVDPAAERGKGKEATTPTTPTAPVLLGGSAGSVGVDVDVGVGNDDLHHHHHQENKDEDGNTQIKEDPTGGPLVIFSCRHLFHRDCLVAIGRPSRLVTGAGTGIMGAGVGQARFFHPDGSGWVPSCPVCT